MTAVRRLVALQDHVYVKPYPTALLDMPNSKKTNSSEVEGDRTIEAAAAEREGCKKSASGGAFSRSNGAPGPRNL